MLKYGLLEPEFYEECDSFKVIFRNGKNGQQNGDRRQQNGERRQQNGERRQQNGERRQQNGERRQQNGERRQQNGERRQQKYCIEELKAKTLEYCITTHTFTEIKEYLKVISRQYVSAKIIKPLIENGLLEYTNKKSIYARNQKYISTSKIVKK